MIFKNYRVWRYQEVTAKLLSRYIAPKTYILISTNIINRVLWATTPLNIRYKLLKKALQYLWIIIFLTAIFIVIALVKIYRYWIYSLFIVTENMIDNAMQLRTLMWSFFQKAHKFLPMLKYLTRENRVKLKIVLMLFNK